VISDINGQPEIGAVKWMRESEEVGLEDDLYTLVPGTLDGDTDPKTQTSILTIPGSLVDVNADYTCQAKWGDDFYGRQSTLEVYGEFSIFHYFSILKTSELLIFLRT